MWLALATVAWAQDYAFPSESHAADFYPTAYKDQGGTSDWNCGSITYSGHRGSDFGVGGFAGMDAGRTVTAAAEGVVIYTNDGEFDRCTSGACSGGGGFGNWVQIEHPDGKTTIYGHLKQWSVAVAVGDPVVCGTVLGEVGSSGNSTGPHLHFEVRNSANTAEDPFDGPCSAPPTYWRSQGVYDGLPDETCGPPPVCVPSGELRCGDVVDARNDDADSTDATTAYGCTEFVYVGPERVWSFTVPVDTPVTLSVTGLSQDLDLMVTDDVACDGTGCVAGSSNPDGDDESAGFDAFAGVTYTVIVDGWEDAVSDFHLEVDCPLLPSGTADTGDGSTTPTTPTPTETGGPIDSDVPGTLDTDVDKPGTLSNGCACGGTFGPAAVFVPLAWVPLTVRRRRRR
jgi:hypothetical protein